MAQDNHIYCIGTMSGTSLDGLDLCYIKINKHDYSDFAILATKAIPYTGEFRLKLATSTELTGLELSLLDIDLGNFFGDSINRFTKENQISKLDFIASHGHTVFHQPEKGLSLQIGSGHTIACKTGKKVICDFRMKDVSFGGQGAPLVPIGDKLLFSQYGQCLNIGGIANISFDIGDTRKAFDICPANMIFNLLAQKEGKEYDKNGDIAKSGKIIPDLLNKLNKIPFYKQSSPKSLGIEWVKNNILPILSPIGEKTADVMRTASEHTAHQIAETSNNNKSANMLITGGGAKNKFLIDNLRQKCKTEIIIPSEEIIDYKEALIFAFLGVLRFTETNNCLRSVTGAKSDNCGGVIYTP